MNYERQTIQASVTDAHGDQVTIEREAMVAAGTGLAYLPWDDGEYGFWVIHLASHCQVGGDWLADDEEEARIWISNLHRIMDWNALKPTVRDGQKGTVIWLAIIGALQQHTIPD